jgi:molybdopterin/thiamine biosynthesis adenylyltransferase
MRGAALSVQEYLEHFGAQQDVLTRSQQLKLRKSVVHVAGLGGIGFHVAMFLSEIGVGFITANDPQDIEIDNLNRLPFASVDSIGVPKAKLLSQLLSRRPHHRIVAIRCRSEQKAARELQSKANFIVCCSNTFASRLATTKTAIAAAVRLIDAGVCDARRGAIFAMRLFNPADRSAACPVCTAIAARESQRDDRILGPVVGAAAALATHSVLRLLTGARLKRSNPNLIELDLDAMTIKKMYVLKNPKCPACSLRPKA